MDFEDFLLTPPINKKKKKTNKKNNNNNTNGSNTKKKNDQKQNLNNNNEKSNNNPSNKTESIEENKNLLSKNTSVEYTTPTSSRITLKTSHLTSPTTKLFNLVRSKDYLAIDSLLKEGEDINAKSYYGITCLHLAVQEGKKKKKRKLKNFKTIKKFLS